MYNIHFGKRGARITKFKKLCFKQSIFWQIDWRWTSLLQNRTKFEVCLRITRSLAAIIVDDAGTQRSQSHDHFNSFLSIVRCVLESVERVHFHERQFRHVCPLKSMSELSARRSCSAEPSLPRTIRRFIDFYRSTWDSRVKTVTIAHSQYCQYFFIECLKTND